MIQKTELRLYWKNIRGSISSLRRESAAKRLFITLQKRLLGKKVLSFASFGTEIDTLLLNLWLAEEKALLLPRIEGSDLQIYEVKDLKRDLIPSALGPLEPNPNRCTLIDQTSIDIVLVPALVFDAAFHRLGYGKGYYDRLLKNLSCPSIGIGFEEQRTEALFLEPWDIPLGAVAYF